MDAWPFLVTRNRMVDYRTVVAPDFLVDAKAAGSLAHLAGGSPGAAPQSKAWNSPIGPLTLFYRVVPATLDGETLQDAHGRAVLLIVGVVVKGGFDELQDKEGVLQRAQEQVMSDFSTFWRSNSHLAIFRSAVISVPSNSSARAVSPLVGSKRLIGAKADESFRWSPKQILVGTGSLLLLLALAVTVRQTRMLMEHQRRMQTQLDSLHNRLDIVEKQATKAGEFRQSGRQGGSPRAATSSEPQKAP